MNALAQAYRDILMKGGCGNPRRDQVPDGCWESYVEACKSLGLEAGALPEGLCREAWLEAQKLLAAAEVTAKPADALCRDCYPPHRLRFHEGRKLVCTMAGCPCRGFVEKLAEAENA